jgi:hypothetical protein
MNDHEKKLETNSVNESLSPPSSSMNLLGNKREAEKVLSDSKFTLLL